MRALITALTMIKAYRANHRAALVADCVPASSASSIDAPASRWIACSRGCTFNKPELLMVLDRPDIPLHTNGSERDIRLHHQAQGQWRTQCRWTQCRDAFLVDAHRAKLGIAFWDYLGDRFSIPGHQTFYLPDIVRRRRRAALSRTARGFAPVTKS